mmetsp:Transcript_8089/g.23817  ORF Transcript_8089/g.23817 Transcript_8089/m.23817 type:complete len:218 (-) Transcript_8089:69-722(-)
MWLSWRATRASRPMSRRCLEPRPVGPPMSCMQQAWPTRVCSPTSSRRACTPSLRPKSTAQGFFTPARRRHRCGDSCSTRLSLPCSAAPGKRATPRPTRAWTCWPPTWAAAGASPAACSSRSCRASESEPLPSPKGRCPSEACLPSLSSSTRPYSSRCSAMRPWPCDCHCPRPPHACSRACPAQTFLSCRSCAPPCLALQPLALRMRAEATLARSWRR